MVPWFQIFRAIGVNVVRIVVRNREAAIQQKVGAVVDQWIEVLTKHPFFVKPLKGEVPWNTPFETSRAAKATAGKSVAQAANMSKEEALQLLGLSPESSFEEMNAKADKLIELNNGPNGSPYVGAKVFTAKAVLEEMYNKQQRKQAP